MKRFLALICIQLIVLMPAYTSALVVMNQQVEAGATYLDVTWETDIDARSHVEYGTTSSVSQSATKEESVTSHSLRLPGLIPDTLYYFRIEGKSTTATIKTLDNVPPDKVTGLTSTSTTRTSITVEWDSSSASDFRHYHMIIDGVNIINTSSTTHTFEGLTAGTAYTIQVAAADNSYNIGDNSDPLTISTDEPDTAPPVISDVEVTGYSASGITIEWKTDEPADEKMLYGQTTLFGSEQASASFKSSHKMTLTGLEDDKKYYYRIAACDDSGNCANSPIGSFIAGVDNTPPEINMKFPNHISSRYITISGTTKPYSIVKFMVGGTLKSTYPDTGKSGQFTFRGIYLGSEDREVTITIIVEDSRGNTNQLTETITIDTVPPTLNVTKVPSVTMNRTVTVEGMVDELVRIDFYQYLLTNLDTIYPPEVTGVDATMADGRVDLVWDSVDISDLKYYVIYRSDIGAIATTTSTTYADTTVLGEQDYTYRVAAVDVSCNLGEKSEPYILTTFPRSIPGENASYINDSCSSLNPQKSIDVVGNFNEEITLQDGRNILRVVATDIAGNTDDFIKEIFVDTTPLNIQETNLRDITPSYIREVTIRGKVNKNATIKVLINGKNSSGSSVGTGLVDLVTDILSGSDSDYVTTTDANGTFSIDVMLTKSIKADGNSSTTIAGLSNVWINNITIIAIDNVGNIDTHSGEIIYALCGEGSEWNVRIGDISPTELVPRHIIEGIAEIGFNFNLSWWGFENEPRVNNIILTYPELSTEMKKSYDIDWVKRKDRILSYDKKYGYVTLSFKHDPNPSGENWTMNKREDNLSENNMGNCFGLPNTGMQLDGVGCVKLPLMLEIDYACDQDFDGEFDENCLQKQCWDVDVMIQPRAPISENIPEEFLNTSIQLMNETIAAINLILCGDKTAKECDGGLIMITKWVMISCGVMWVLSFLKAISEYASCAGVNLNDFQTVPVDGGFECKTSDGKDTADMGCQQCVQAKYSTLQWKRTMNLVCDRIFCPSVPSIEYYSELMNGGKQKGFDFAGDKPITNCPANYKSEEGYKGGVDDPGMETCKYNLILPPGNQKTECCEEEYMYNWDYGALMMNELKESECLWLKSTNKKDKGLYKETWEQNCGGWRSAYRGIADFSLCNDDNEPDYKAFDMGNDRYFLIYLKGDKREAWSATYHKEQTIIEGDDSFEKPGESSVIINGGDKVRVGNTNEYYTNKDRLLNMMDSSCDQCDNNPGNNDACKGCACYVCLHKDETEFKDDSHELCVYTPPGETEKEPIPETIINEVCTFSNEKYVIDPTSGLLRSIQSVCLSSIVGYLKHYRQVLTLIMNCFQTILITGDGSAGVCRSVLTMYVCDLIYYAISCVDDYVTAGYGEERPGLVGFFKHVAGSYNSVQGSISNRYGSSNLYRVMFVKKKLIHAICLGAFTGDWDIDLEGMLTEATDVPIATTAAIAPATRRFTTYNGVNGRATHIYHLGVLMVAGADIEYSLELICSADNSCNAQEGFENGKCDCAWAGIGEKVMVLNNRLGGGSLSKSSVINEELYIQVESKTDNSKYRYDKARLRYKYRDNNNDPKEDEILVDIKKIGGDAPASCKFDAAVLYYRCSFYIGSRGNAFFGIEPKAPGELGLGDYVMPEDYSVVIEKPDGSSHNFYLRYSITNKDGNDPIPHDATKEKTLDHTSEKTFSSINRFPYFKLDKEHFSTVDSAGKAKVCNGEIENWNLNLAILYPELDSDGTIRNQASTEIAQAIDIPLVVKCSSGDTSPDQKSKCKEIACDSGSQCNTATCEDGKIYYCAASDTNGKDRKWTWRTGSSSEGAYCSDSGAQDKKCIKEGGSNVDCKDYTEVAILYSITDVEVNGQRSDGSKGRFPLNSEICVIKSGGVDVYFKIRDSSGNVLTDGNAVLLDLWHEGKEIGSCSHNSGSEFVCHGNANDLSAGKYSLYIAGQIKDQKQNSWPSSGSNNDLLVQETVCPTAT